MFSDITAMENDIYGDDDDADLEEELRQLQAEVDSSSSPHVSPKRAPPASSSTGTKKSKCNFSKLLIFNLN